MPLTYPDPALTDDVVNLRKWRMADTDCIRLATADPSITSSTSVPTQFTEDAARAFVARQWSRKDQD